MFPACPYRSRDTAPDQRRRGAHGHLAVVHSIAGDVGLTRMTLARYLDLLELVFVIRRIPCGISLKADGMGADNWWVCTAAGRRFGGARSRHG
jgi:hypothetical protein